MRSSVKKHQVFMFTGIVEATATVKEIIKNEGNIDKDNFKNIIRDDEKLKQ